jgi:hypothetical protein
MATSFFQITRPPAVGSMSAGPAGLFRQTWSPFFQAFEAFVYGRGEQPGRTPARAASASSERTASCYYCVWLVAESFSFSACLYSARCVAQWTQWLAQQLTHPTTVPRKIQSFKLSNDGSSQSYPVVYTALPSSSLGIKIWGNCCFACSVPGKASSHPCPVGCHRWR